MFKIKNVFMILQIKITKHRFGIHFSACWTFNPVAFFNFKAALKFDRVILATKYRGSVCDSHKSRVRIFLFLVKTVPHKNTSITNEELC